jgi:hypothetical protein
MRAVEVAVSAQHPSVMVDQICDQPGLMTFIKANWTVMRTLFWTVISCCRHRYASFETPFGH